MKLSIIDIDDFCKDLPEITSYKIFENCKITKTGLFSQQIFGPIQSYKCGCLRSYFRGPHSGEKICQVCGVEITSSEERSKRFAKIVLPFEVLNPIFYFLLIKTKPSCKKIIDNLLSYKVKYYYDDDNNLIKITPEFKNDKNYEILDGLSGVKIYINNLCETLKKKEINYINKNKNLLTINNIIVIPPAFRNVGKNSKGTHSTDVINRLYIELLMRISHIKNTPYNLSEKEDIYKIYFKTVQTYVFNISKYIIDKLSGKTGLIRGNILGKRLDFSARAVVSPDPTLNMDECSVPYLICLELFKPKIIVHMINKKIFKHYNHAAKAIEQAIQKKDYIYFDLVKDFCNNKLCFINRQPTLHRMSIIGLKIKVNDTYTIQIHPLLVNAMNMDFDGDAAALYSSNTEEFDNEIINKLGVENNLISPTNCSPIPKCNQDIVLGIYSLTNE